MKSILKIISDIIIYSIMISIVLIVLVILIIGNELEKLYYYIFEHEEYIERFR